MKTDVRRALRLGWLVTLAALAAPFAWTPSAHAQTSQSTTTAPKKKKKKKPKGTDSGAAQVEVDADAPAAAPPPAAPPPPAETETAPVDATKEDVATNDKPAVVAPTEGQGVEKDGERYHFIGIRYRGGIIPKFLINLFADEGTGVYSNQIGIEYEIRHDGFSMIPWATYAEYGFGSTLFLQSGQPQQAQYYSDVNSSLKAIYAGIDLLWSAPISNKVQFEYGGGAGIGFFFGSIGTSWVQSDTNGPLVAANGAHYSDCTAVVANTGCDPHLHTNATTIKLAGHTEPNWFSGGSVPAFFPAFTPEIGVRYKPIPELALRGTVGIALTGFFFGISGSYGLNSLKE